MEFDISYNDLNKFLAASRTRLKVTYLKNNILGLTYKPAFFLPKIIMVIQLVKFYDYLVCFEYRCVKGGWLLFMAQGLNLIPKGIIIDSDKQTITIKVGDMKFNDNLKHRMYIKSLDIDVNRIKLSTFFYIDRNS